MAESWASNPAARASMRGNRSRDTKPELAAAGSWCTARAFATALIVRRSTAHRRHRADLVFTRAEVAVLLSTAATGTAAPSTIGYPP
ncbi:hypothetical protein ACNQVK_37445 [Mycobacterium sp. 134]|uniref:hypothetical protein n=1 Tax=Mycobacterium sp. 134 TaxID=3400425 RepID=UPI003AABEBC2